MRQARTSSTQLACWFHMTKCYGNIFTKKDPYTKSIRTCCRSTKHFPTPVRSGSGSKGRGGTTLSS